MARMNEVAARIMEHLCTCSKHGYTQAARWGDGTTESITVDGKKYTFAGGDRDCSSAIISAYKAAGLNVSATYTGNMRSGFLATGKFEWKPMSFTAQRGDIYLNEANHTAMCTSAIPDMLAEFSISENGTIYGNKGDQTGYESRIKGYYDFPWDGILHFKGGSATGGSSAGEKAAPKVDKTQPTYRIMANGQWFDEMVGLVDTGGSGDDYGGAEKCAAQFIAIMGVGKYRVWTRLSGREPLEWVYAYNVNDYDKGCAGDGSAITRLEIPNDKVKYQVHSIKNGWFDWMVGSKDTGGSGDTYAGDGTPIDMVRIKLA